MSKRASQKVNALSRLSDLLNADMRTETTHCQWKLRTNYWGFALGINDLHSVFTIHLGQCIQEWTK